MGQPRTDVPLSRELVVDATMSFAMKRRLEPSGSKIIQRNDMPVRLAKEQHGVLGSTPGPWSVGSSKRVRFGVGVISCNMRVPPTPKAMTFPLPLLHVIPTSRTGVKLAGRT